ncbi:MAG: NUDIX domain-containing protein [Chloroflexi bacterium]|nr:MAG: NUDIX domain-containing protein [Chloroflexota bacterium]
MGLRLGVMCAVIDDRDRILLSCRGDFKVWALPSGRLDADEYLPDAVVREVREETGLIVQVERPVGLYFMPAFRRMNVLYEAWPLGGELLQKTDETRENRYFPRYALPKMPLDIITSDALADHRPPPRIIDLSPNELRQLRWKLRRRWLWNRLRGKPEPKWPRFDVRAVVVIHNTSYRRVLTVANHSTHILPCVLCDGSAAPWQQLREIIAGYGVHLPVLHWVGLWQDTTTNRIEFIFAAAIDEVELHNNATWTSIRNAPLMGRDITYAKRVAAGFLQADVWTIIQGSEDGEGDDRIRKSMG